MRRRKWLKLAPKKGLSPAPRLGKGPHPPAPRRVRCPLRSQSEIADELARLYRRARAGEVDAQTAGRLAYILRLLSKVREVGDLEQRIEQLEAQLND